MSKLRNTVSRTGPALIFVFGLMAVPTLATDLSKYRGFQFGTRLPAVAIQAGADVSQTKVIHRRPALIQELAWRPQPLGATSQSESVQGVVFRFFDGELFRVTISYDRFETEGMTNDDIVDAVSATYGTAERLTAPANAVRAYSDEEEVVARWQDPEYRFDLVRSSYGPTFKLIGVLKRLEAPARTAIAEAARLDDLEAPQRDAARLADEKEVQQAKLDKTRLLNKPKFRP
jgi:hypothetical protein